MSKTRIPFKSSNNKNSPYNMNEIDINFLMENPKHIHKLMGRDESDDEDSDKIRAKNRFDEKYQDTFPLIDLPKHLRNTGKNVKDNLDFFKSTGSNLLKKYMDKPKNKHRTIAERLNKSQDNFYKKVDEYSGKASNEINKFKNDVEKKGLGKTIGNRMDRWDDLISDFINGETMMKIGKKLEPGADIIRHMKKGGIEAERERERKRGMINIQRMKERKERMNNFDKE